MGECHGTRGDERRHVERLIEVTPAGALTLIKPGENYGIGLVAVGSDGAIWWMQSRQKSYFLSRLDASGTQTDSREVGPSIGICDHDDAPVEASAFLAGPGDIFWVAGRNAILSTPTQNSSCHIPYSTGRFTADPDGALWTVGEEQSGSTSAAERLLRLDPTTGLLDRSATLPGGNATALAAGADGSIWLVNSKAGKQQLVRYQPTSLLPVAIWTGAGQNGFWSNPANWQDATLPTNGGVVHIQHYATVPKGDVLTDDLGPLDLQSLEFGSPGASSETLKGDRLSLGAGGLMADYATNIDIANPVTITGTVSLDTLSAAQITMSGVISGPGGISERSPGGVTLTLTANNTYTGTTLLPQGAVIEGDQPASPVIVKPGAELVAGGEIGPLTLGGVLDPATWPSQCPSSLRIDGPMTLGPSGSLAAGIEACGTPPARSVSHVAVTGPVTLSHLSQLTLHLQGDTPQLACLLSATDPITGKFANAKEGQSIPDPAGGTVTFSYTRPGGADCLPHAFTAQTGVNG